MGFLDVFTRMLANKQVGQVAGEFNGADVTAYSFMKASDGIEGHTIEKLWETQPHLRTVVGFIARQMSQLSLKMYERDGDGIGRVRDGEIAKLLKTPNQDDTFSELLEALVSELALWDDAYLMLMPDRTLRVFPTRLVTVVEDNTFSAKAYKVVGRDQKQIEFKPENVFRFKGWTPSGPLKAKSPVTSLKLMLEEQHDARIYRKQVWQRGGRFGGWLFRPKDAPAWDDAARGRFDRMWQAFTGNGGSRAGDAPLLEDGMEYRSARVAAKEDQWLESVKASLEMCAQVYYINPTMVGLLDNANFSNVREFRRSLYGESLGPIVKKIEDRFNSFILPALGASENQYVEFNVEAKLRGSFEEQAKVISTATGAPWQTVNEARALFNLTPLEGGDDIVRPLNVLFGGQSSPQDGGGVEQSMKAHEALIRSFVARQSEAVCAKRDTGAVNWWDRERWDRELIEDLTKAGMREHLAFSVARDVNTRAFEEYSAGRSVSVDQVLEVES